jgi:hypothetical protein
MARGTLECDFIKTVKRIEKRKFIISFLDQIHHTIKKEDIAYNNNNRIKEGAGPFLGG